MSTSLTIQEKITLPVVGYVHPGMTWRETKGCRSYGPRQSLHHVVQKVSAERSTKCELKINIRLNDWFYKKFKSMFNFNFVYYCFTKFDWMLNFLTNFRAWSLVIEFMSTSQLQSSTNLRFSCKVRTKRQLIEKIVLQSHWLTEVGLIFDSATIYSYTVLWQISTICAILLQSSSIWMHCNNPTLCL